MISLTSIGAESERVVILELANVAVSPGPFGTVSGIQLAAVFQSPLTGLALHVALPANEWAPIKHEKRQMRGKRFFILPIAAESDKDFKAIRYSLNRCWARQSPKQALPTAPQ